MLSGRTLLCRGLFRAGLLGVALLETIDAAGGIEQLLLAGEVRMALRTDLDAQLFFRRAGGPRLAAGAVRLNLLIFRVNLWFHWLYLFDGLFQGRTGNGQYIKKIARRGRSGDETRALRDGLVRQNRNANDER